MRCMADRASAELFSSFFRMLAEDPTEQHRQMAHRLWRMTRHYDFAPYQLECNDALKALGLARKQVDSVDPDEGAVWCYGPEGETAPEEAGADETE